jgi:hypothetical protein
MKTTNFDEKIEDIKNGMSYTEYLTKWSCNASNYYYLNRNKKISITNTETEIRRC